MAARFRAVRAGGPDGGVDLGANRVALADQGFLAQRYGSRNGFRGSRFGRIAPASAPTAGEREESQGQGRYQRVSESHRWATLAKRLDALCRGFKAAAQGLEPRLPLPERGVLPLHQAAKRV
jgi:hypothetical protein